jgi:predicted nucleotidyltransferase
MYILSETALKSKLSHSGYATQEAFCRETGYSRNTLASYLKGKSVFHPKFEELARILKSAPTDLILVQKAFNAQGTILEKMISRLRPFFHQYAFVLFGSRAKETHDRGSDWDVGIYHTKTIPGNVFLNVRRKVDDVIEEAPQNIELTNLTLADRDFLKDLKGSVQFLAGRWLPYRRLLDRLEQL